MLHRTLTTALHRAVNRGGPVLLEGPRGSGKTMLVRNEFPRWVYVSLDEAVDRRAARTDPAAFLARLRGPAVIDDVHRAPELVAHFAERPEPRPAILASSRKLSLPITTLRLYSPTRAEREGRPPLPLEMLGRFVPVRTTPPRKSVPWPVARNLIERDIRELVHVRDLDRFGAFLEIALGRSGQILDQQKLARLAGTSRTTVVRWLAVLETCFLTVRVEPCDYHLGRRLVRSPKLHFIGSESFESMVVSDIYRNAVHTGTVPDLRYWRDSNGMEIALVLQLPGSPPMPVSVVESPGPKEYVRLQRWMNLAGIHSAALVSLRAPEQRRGPILRYAVDQL